MRGGREGGRARALLHCFTFTMLIYSEGKGTLKWEGGTDKSTLPFGSEVA